MDSYTEVFTWGSNAYGQMGLESSNSYFPIPRICSFNILIIQVSCGTEHSALLSNQHFIYTMGSNSDGKLGIDDKSLAYTSYPMLIQSLIGEKVIEVSCGGSHTAAVTHQGDLYTWGKGAILGHGDLLTKWAPQKLVIEYTYIIQVSCGENHIGIVGIRNKERICMMCGCGENGQLGLGDKEDISVPQKVSISDVKEIACGDSFSLFLNTHGAVFGTGRNYRGQLGLGNCKDVCLPVKVKALENVFVTKVSAGGISGCISEDGVLYVWGLNSLVPSVVQGCPKDIIDLSIGKKFGAVITRTSALWTWGDNYHGQLGLGDFNEKEGICLVNSLSKRKVTKVSCGSDFIIVLGEDLIKKHSHTKSPEKTIKDNLLDLKLTINTQPKVKSNTKKKQEQFWSSERNQTDDIKNSKDTSIYEKALRKLNKILIEKEKELLQEKEYRLKNEGYRQIYIELEEKLASVVKIIDFEKSKKEELEISHAKNESRLLSIIREKEDQILILKNENYYLRRKTEEKKPCANCTSLISELSSLKTQNESLLSELLKKDAKNLKLPREHSYCSPEVSGLYVPQSPSFDKSLDKSLDRHKLINTQLKISRSESELLKLIETPINAKSPTKTDRRLPLLKLDQETQEEYPLPTFRNQDESFFIQQNLKNSLAEIKARINTLNSNRSELQNKMEDLEIKLLKKSEH